MRLFSVAAFALFSASAFAAAPVITGGSGYSNITLTGTPTFFGGMVGSSVTGDGSNPVDTCAGITTPVACNTTSIYGTLILRVAATHTDSGNLIIARATDKFIPTHILPYVGDAASVRWDDLCNMMTPTPGPCSTATGLVQLRLYVDKNLNGAVDSDEEGVDFQVKLIRVPTGYDVYGTSGSTEGISDFTPYPGDEKVYIEDPISATTGLSLGYGSKAVKVRVFSSTTNMTEATPGTGLEPQDLNLVENGNTLDNSVVDGLANGVLHFFRIGLVDEGNNLVLMMPDGNNTDCNNGTAPPACKYAATPDEVLGLLTDDVNCFVATAAYGSGLEPKLKTFRDFRYKRLLPYSWGRKFVKWYYHYGPYLARYIHDKPMMRAGARVLLWPAYGFSRMALSFGIWPALAFTLSLISLLLALPFLRVRKTAPLE